MSAFGGEADIALRPDAMLTRMITSRSRS